ncbi:MAG TPA: FAD-dependent oxidoreductase [Candidatus Acidoferrales bacterium]|jgi:thioredoxin reductase|nr:FAD-dependent oxidoreductase [Candidatus Acidoferrales bacterium]
MSGAVALHEVMPRRRVADCEVAIVGAGPYGLSAAAHLKVRGMEVRVFGRAMEFWASKMPAGMLLRSPRVASNISGPTRTFSLDEYESSAGVQPRAPLPLETFVDYGRWFQRELIPDLDQREVASVRRDESGFRLALEDGEEIHCRRVVVAAGIGPFQRVPSVFASLPPSQVSHCYQGRDLQAFRSSRVVVIGAGQSALESAALLHEAGAKVELIVRTSDLRWIGARPWLRHLGPISSMLYSPHDVGPAGISRLVAAPSLVKHIPVKLRDRIRRRAVRPAGAKWLPARLKQVKVTTGRFVTEAASVGQSVELRLNDGSGLSADHVLLGTGYSVDVSRYRFLPQDLLKDLDLMDGYPRLRAGFSSSISGLHFIGATAARTFGPLLYFVAGTEFASGELASHLVRHRAVRQ